jgi:radical SAM protein with 4Fe4S-binding SPASM domain
MKPGTCTMRDPRQLRGGEYNGDIYPCDFSWRRIEARYCNGGLLPEVARRKRRYELPVRSCPASRTMKCEWQSICHQGCPKFRHAQPPLQDLDYFCQSYKMIYAMRRAPAQEVDKPSRARRRPWRAPG